MVKSSRWKGTALRNLSGEKGTILVVDDEASIRRILQTRLEMIGYSVVTASDGEETLSAFRLLTPDLIGHEVTLATHENFEPFVRKFDLKFAPIAGNMQEFLQSKQGQRLKSYWAMRSCGLKPKS